MTSQSWISQRSDCCYQLNRAAVGVQVVACDVSRQHASARISHHITHQHCANDFINRWIFKNILSMEQKGRHIHLFGEWMTIFLSLLPFDAFVLRNYRQNFTLWSTFHSQGQRFVHGLDRKVPEFALIPIVMELTAVSGLFDGCTAWLWCHGENLITRTLHTFPVTTIVTCQIDALTTKIHFKCELFISVKFRTYFQ